MTAVSAPFGILPDWHPTGQIRPTAYKGYNAASSVSANAGGDAFIPSGTNVIFQKGQVVKIVVGTGGAVNGVTISTGSTVLAPITATTDAPLGVFAGVEYVDSTGKPWVQNFWPASQALLSGSPQTVYVWDDPEIIYRAQMDGPNSVAPNLCLTGKQINVSNFAAGSALTGLSQCTLSGTNVSTGSQGQFRIIKIFNDALSALYWGDAFPVVEVKLQFSPFVAAKTSL
jgi:hypothetical protein